MYLDYASTTPLTEEVKQYVVSILDSYGNPSSAHNIGLQSKQIVDNARNNVAKFINADSEEIIFTSSGSASNTLAIRGYAYNNKISKFLYSPTAHKSVLKCVETLRFARELKVDNCGFIQLDDLTNKLNESLPLRVPSFVVVEYANSEIGTVQNVKKIIELVHEANGVVLLDCTGSISTIPINVKELDVDMVSFSAHKLGAFKGCGVLYKKKNIQLEPIIYGNQEQGLFGGTENVLGIASLGKAVENYNYSSISSESRDYVYNYIIKNIYDTYIIGAPIDGNRLSHNLYVCFKGVNGESLVTLLDLNVIQVSTGSACNNYSPTPSTTLSAIGIKEEDINSCIRFSFSGNETNSELDFLCQKIKECVKQLRCFG